MGIGKLRIYLTLIFLAALGIAALWLLVPPPEGVPEEEFFSPLGVPLTLLDMGLALGAAILFFRAYKNFKKELKPAYRFIASAQLLLGLLTLFFPYVEYYFLWENDFWNGSTYTPYFFGSILMFFGARKFYHILGFRNWVSSLKVIGIIFLAAWGIHAFLPHELTWPNWGEKEYMYDLFEAVTILPVICYGAATYMIARIRSRVGSEYKKAFGWLAVGLGLQTFATGAILYLDTTGYENWYFATRTYMAPTLIGDLALLAAAYYFNAVGIVGTNHASLWQRLWGNSQSGEATSLDILTYTANLSSDTSKVDQYLDEMRIISSQLQPGEVPSADQQKKLRDVYLKIEKYLVESEPLRTFDREGLRRDISHYFGLTKENAGKTFWPHLT